jgi:hypothetical protein
MSEIENKATEIAKGIKSFEYCSTCNVIERKKFMRKLSFNNKWYCQRCYTKAKIDLRDYGIGVCVLCGKEFKKIWSSQIYCKECKNYNKNKKETKHCLHCGTGFITGIKNHVFCSVECNRKYRSRLNISPKIWEIKREAVFEMCLFKCADCGGVKMLDVHHITPMALGGSNDLDNLILLCRSCHGKRHKYIINSL